MPKKASRITLRITNVGVARVQSITNVDALLEGVSDFEEKVMPKDLFKKLWIKINGQNSWDENPFVWALSFNVVRSSKHYR